MNLHHLTDVLVEQLMRGQEVVLVVLFQHRELARRGERSQAHRGRVDARRHVREAQLPGAILQLDGAHLANQAEVLVVDGDGDLTLVGQGGLLGIRPLGRDSEGGDQDHRSREQGPQGNRATGIRVHYSSSWPATPF
ncbi:hypothetical protein D3C72_1902160 [compost metagenome]